MSSLSPLVVHGKLLWESVVALACVAGIVAAWLLPRRARRRRAAAIRAGLGGGTSSLAPPSPEKLVVVSGKVVKASGSPEKKLAAATLVPAAMAFAEEGSKSAHTATAAGEPLVLEVGGAHVALHGDVQILVGSRESGRGLARRRAHRALEDLASQLEGKTRDGLALRTLHTGDLVRAQGILRHTPSETGAESYRVAASAYTLSPSEEGNHPGIVPVAFEGAPSPLEQSRPEVVGRVLAFPALAFVALAAVGELAMHSAPSSPGVATIAAATPLRRFEALAALRAQTSLSASPSDATLRDQASLDTLRGFYGMASDDYARANRPDEAAKIAAHYGDPFRVARARFVNGEISESARAFASARARDPKLPITISEVTAYVLTDDFERAATGAHALLANWDGPKGSQDELQCIVDAIDHRAGGSHDTGALERHAREGATRVPCTLLMLDLRDGTEGASGDDTLSELRSDPRVRRYLEPLTPGRFGSCTFPASDILGCWDASDAFGPGMITDPKAIAFYLPQALALQAFQHTLSEVSSHGWLGADMALAASLYAATRTFLGDVEGALTILDVAGRAFAPLARRAELEERRRASLDPPQDPHFPHDPRDGLDLIRSTRAAVLLRSGRARDALRLQPSGMAARFSTLAHVMGAYDPSEQRELAERDDRELNAKLWNAAYTGDGTVLVDALRAGEGDGRGVVDVVAWHIPSGRAALASWVRYEYPAPCSTCGLYPLMNSLGSRLDAAHATGDEATVRELDAVRVRLDPYLARRQDALLVHFLSLLSPP
ncbi:MAG: hypothetical protein IPK71_33265 [Myxococcales bacterium]|nr:hypothetical protein [Myxococcales bacterium]